MLLIKVLVIVVAASVPTVLLAYLLALFDFIFMTVPSGQIKVIVKGESFHWAIPNIDGHTIDHVTNDIRPLKPGETDPNKTFLNNWFGLWMVGIPVMRSVFHYDFRWPKIKITGEEDDGSKIFHIDRREENVKTIFWRYAYPVVSKESEVKGQIPQDISTLVTIEIVNPRKALFDIQPPGEWLTRAMGVIIAAIRKYASQRTLEELQQELRSSSTTAGSGKPSNTDFEKEIMRLANGTDKKPSKLVTQIGVKVSAISMLSIKVHDPTGDNRLTNAVTAKVVAEEEAKAVRAKADGDAYQIDKIGTARAEVIKKIAKADAKRVKDVVVQAASVPGGADVLIAEAQRDGITASKAGTLVVGQHSGVMLNASNAPVRPTAPAGTTPP